VSIWGTVNPLQIASLIVPILILLTSITIFYKSRKIKKLSYSILTDTTINPHNKELSGRIKLCYEETPDKFIPMGDGRLFILKIINDGNESIKPSDFVEPISISLDPSVTILDKAIITSPDALKEPKLDTYENNIILEPLLLNERDFVTIKLLLIGLKEKTGFKLRARIVGISDIKSLEKEIRIPPILFTMIGIISGIILSIILENFINNHNLVNFQSQNQFYIITLLLLALLIFAEYIRHRRR
jgi:hypothetical protein